MSHAEVLPAPSTHEAIDEKVAVVPHYQEDLESNSDKAVPGAGEASVPYSGQGSAQDKALVYKQDLRIVRPTTP